MQIQLKGIEQAVANLGQLPRKVALRHLRVALNAAGGTVRNAAKALAPRESGALKNSLRVKVKIPDASWDVRHHGKPAYVVVGPGRGITKPVQRRRGKIRVLSAKKASVALNVKLRKPSRYAHLAERAQPFLGPASKTAGPAASARAAEKLAKAFETEAAALPK